MCEVAVAKFNELDTNLLPYLSYSPDLTPSDCFLFPNLQNWRSGKEFGFNNEIISLFEGTRQNLFNIWKEEKISETLNYMDFKTHYVYLAKNLSFIQKELD